jgi:hypothetical protein
MVALEARNRCQLSVLILVPITVTIITVVITVELDWSHIDLFGPLRYL